MQCKAKNPISTHTCSPSPGRMLEQIPRFYIHSVIESSLSNGLKSIYQFPISSNPAPAPTLSCQVPRPKRHIGFRQGNVEKAHPGMNQESRRCSPWAIRGPIPGMQPEVFRLADCFRAGVHEKSDNQPVQTCEGGKWLDVIVQIGIGSSHDLPKTSAKMRIRIIPTYSLGC